MGDRRGSEIALFVRKAQFLVDGFGGPLDTWESAVVRYKFAMPKYSKVSFFSEIKPREQSTPVSHIVKHHLAEAKKANHSFLSKQSRRRFRIGSYFFRIRSSMR